MSNQDYYDRTLISLRRQYSKDEAIAAMSKKLSQADIEIGKLKAEIDHLHNQLEVVSKQYKQAIEKEQNEVNKAGRVEARKFELYKNKVLECKKQKVVIKQLMHQRNILIGKYYQLQKQTK